MKSLLLQTLLLWLQCSIGLSQKLILPTIETEPLVDVIGIAGETVQLPCNLSLNKMREIELILWYKGQTGKPIFTLDTRTTPLLKHLSSSTRRTDLYSNSKLGSTNLLNKLQQSPLISVGTKRAENRLVFNLTGELAYLQIKQVSITDQSEYKCRVDYKQSRSDYHQVNLTVIVPPKSLKILNAKNKESLESLIGPFNEKDTLVLTCQAKQGQPGPLHTIINWYRNGEPIEPPLAVNSNQTSLDGSLPEAYIDGSSLTHSSYTSSNLLASEENLANNQQNNLANVQIRQRQLMNGVIESEITILSLNRDFLLNRIECRSSLQHNGQIIRRDYQIVSVTLDLNLSPLIAKIRSKSSQTEFKVNTLAEFSCEVIGSRPPPKISWYIVTPSNQMIDLVPKKQLSNANQQQPTQLLNEENLEEYSIYQHLSPSTSPNVNQLNSKLFKSTNQHTSASSLLNSNSLNTYSNVNILNDQLSATSATKLVSKQPFIFTIDYPLLSQDGNTSSSVLKLRLSQRMHNNRLICRANNFEVQRDSEIEDQQLLNVLYAPLVRIELGSNIQENSIKEGSDVYFECKINANPYVHEIQWFFNGNLLASNYNGILIANHSLVLQSVKRETKGYYSCAAINSQGKSHSQNFFLRILYAPVCREPQRTTYGLALGETAKILCEVDADPVPNSFLWYFNNSNEKIPLRNFTVNQTSSVLTYQPRSRYSYGVLLCFGRNEIGSQIKSCNYQLVHASPPEVVKNCEILAASSKAAKNYLQQNTNFLKLITSTAKNRNSLIDETNLMNELNNQPNRLMTNFYTLEELNSKSTKSLLKTNSPFSDFSTASPRSQSNNTFLSNNQISQFTNHSDLHPSQRLNFAEPTLPTNQLQLNLDLLENAMLIKCQSGFNGGLKQIFFLEIYDLIEQRLYLNITSVDNPVFLLTELKSNTKFNLNIYAANVKGRSSSVNLNFHTFQPQISNAKKQASEESIYGSFLSIFVTIGTASVLIFSLLMLFLRLRIKQPRNCPSLDRSSSASTIPSNNQSQYKDAQLNPLKSSLSGRIYNNEMQNSVSEGYDYVKEAFNNQNQHNLDLVQSEICFKQPEVAYAELSILSPNGGNYSTGSALANQTQNPADFVDLDFQLINHNHLATINTSPGLPIGMHTIAENDYSAYGQYNTLLNPISNISNQLRIHYSTSLVNSSIINDSPAMTMHSKLATLDTNTARTLSSASTATADTRQMIENTNCDLQSNQYN